MKFTNQPITETLETNYMPYAMSVIISRAIPEIDGLKPSHRKLLYTMYKMGLLNGARTKSANVVGQTMKLNPHGDMAIYETLVRLTEGNGALLHPLIDSKGSFGKQYSRDMAFAASRYTECKLASICNEVFSDIDKNVVEFVDNYDGTLKEPVLLPVKFPAVLTNSNQGIAVGMASNICSFNLKEVCDTTIAYLKNPNCKIEKTLLAPDFSTGGELIFEEETIKSIYETGRGTVKVRSVYSYDKKNNCIDITEIPYSTTAEAIIEKIIELIRQNKIRDISDVRDETDLKGLKITIDLKRGCDHEKLMTKLFKMTPLMDSFGCNFNILVDNHPKVMGIREILLHWTNFRINCIKRQLQYDIDKKSARLHLLEGLEKILLDIDKAIKIIRETEHEVDVVPNLMNGFGIDQVQAEFIAEIKLRNLNKEYILKRTRDIEDLIDEISSLKSTLADENKIKEVIIGQLKEISKKYGKERQTKIISNEEIEEFHEEEFIENYNLKLFLTKDGYFKKISYVSLRSSGEQKVKENDYITQEFDTDNLAEIIIFTNMHNAYKVFAYEMNDCKASVLGDYLPTVLDMEQGETVLGMAVTSDFSENIVFCFENGKMAKVPISAYKTKQHRKKLTNAYGSVSPLVKLFVLKEDIELASLSSADKILVFNTDKIPLKTTKSTQGVNVMTLRRNAVIKDVITVEELLKTEPDIKGFGCRKIPAAGGVSKKDQMTMF